MGTVVAGAGSVVVVGGIVVVEVVEVDVVVVDVVVVDVVVVAGANGVVGAETSAPHAEAINTTTTRM
jgi:hypothetical protein